MAIVDLFENDRNNTMKYKFCFEDKRTRRATHDMILAMAKHGNGGRNLRFVSDADVKRFFVANGYIWDDLVQSCRKQNENVPLVENLIGSTWTVVGARAAIVTEAATDKEKEIASVEGPGSLTTSSYLLLFENAIDNFHRCMERASFGDFQSCVSNGVASVDAYIAHRALLYNSGHSSELLVDSKETKVSQDTKIDEWIPKMSGETKLNKSGLNWNHFKKLRGIRDELAVHIKKPAIGITYQQLCELLNLFRTGIAGLLIDLHLIFDERIPCKIIKYAYLPDVKLLETED